MIAQTYTVGSIDSLSDYLGFGKVVNGNRVEDRAERVAWESGRRVLGAESIGVAKELFKQSAARKGRRVEKPTYEIILSWQRGNREGIPPDNPTRKEMEWAVDQVLEELGLDDREAWIVAHKDTPAPHVHVMVNRVHPRSGETWSPSYDLSILYNRLRKIEEKMGWHRPGPMRIEELPDEEPENLEYWEVKAGKLGREPSVRRWAREEGLCDDLLEASSWPEAVRITEKRSASRGAPEKLNW